VVMGYYPWLWSYGLDYGQRQADVAIATSGCGTTSLAQCQSILQILHRYDISYVEVNQTFIRGRGHVVGGAGAPGHRLRAGHHRLRRARGLMSAPRS
jgi:hypothetical protein